MFPWKCFVLRSFLSQQRTTFRPPAWNDLLVFAAGVMATQRDPTAEENGEGEGEAETEVLTTEQVRKGMEGVVRMPPLMLQICNPLAVYVSYVQRESRSLQRGRPAFAGVVHGARSDEWPSPKYEPAWQLVGTSECGLGSPSSRIPRSMDTSQWGAVRMTGAEAVGQGPGGRFPD